MDYFSDGCGRRRQIYVFDNGRPAILDFENLQKIIYDLRLMPIQIEEFDAGTK